MDGGLTPGPAALKAANAELARVNARLAFALENPLPDGNGSGPSTDMAVTEIADLEARLSDVERQSRAAGLRIEAASSALAAILASRSWLVVRGFRALKRLPRR